MGNVTSNIAAKFAFFPPEPPSYDVFRDEEDTPNGDKRYCITGITADKNVDVHLLDTKVGNKIVATFWKHPFGKFTLLYSHGNAADLGQMQELFIELRAHLRLNIMRYLYLFPIPVSLHLFIASIIGVLSDSVEMGVHDLYASFHIWLISFSHVFQSKNLCAHTPTLLYTTVA